MKNIACSTLAVSVLAGCMTPAQVSTASTEQLINAACVNPGMTRQETIDAAVWELERRGVDCRAIAMQTLMMRAANPMPAPRPLRPYIMPTQQAPSTRPALASQPSTAFGTLIGTRNTTTATGQPAYACQYRTTLGWSETIQPVAQGPCPPTANLQ